MFIDIITTISISFSFPVVIVIYILIKIIILKKVSIKLFRAFKFPAIVKYFPPEL